LSSSRSRELVLPLLLASVALFLLTTGHHHAFPEAFSIIGSLLFTQRSHSENSISLNFVPHLSALSDCLHDFQESVRPRLCEMLLLLLRFPSSRWKTSLA
jgi:hypothetical protein